MQFQDSWVSGLALRYLEVKSLDLAPGSYGSYLEIRCLGQPPPLKKTFILHVGSFKVSVVACSAEGTSDEQTGLLKFFFVSWKQCCASRSQHFLF